MEILIVFLVIIFGLLQLMLLVKIWHMTDDVRMIKEKFNLYTRRGLAEERRIELITETVYKRLKDWYKVRKSSNKTKVESTVVKYINEDIKYVQNLLDEYDVNDFYTIDQLKETMVDKFIRV